MFNRKTKLLLAVILLPLCIGGILFSHGSRHAKIDEWSGALTADKVAWAEVAADYGIHKQSYDLAPEEYAALVELLRTVTEENSARKSPASGERIDYRLSLHADGKLWLFHCRNDGLVALTFNDPETGAYFGCEGKLLYIDSPALWEYIVDTVDSKAK